MPEAASLRRYSAFDAQGFRRTVDGLVEEIQMLYCSDQIPWVVGYSGGKDSTATLQLVWMALSRLPPAQRTKDVHVISTDTLVENPVVAAWVERSLKRLDKAAQDAGLTKVKVHRLTPEPQDTFWVNLIGKGYPAPRPKFRWCTERLKIKPSNRFIGDIVDKNGEAIVVLGTRKAESAARARVMEELEDKRQRGRLSPNKSLPNSFVYSPVEDWTNDDIWLFLMQVKNPWGHDNKELLTLYQGASADGECPLVIDTTTPSCGNSRFGCWVCTLVDKDKSMQAMILNDTAHEWMQPLLTLRNALDIADDRPLRDFRRMSGRVQLFHDRPVRGPYTQASREMWLRRVLEAQREIRRHGPPDVEDITLISLPELQEIRRIWVVEKHEFEDILPGLYEEVMGCAYPGGRIDDAMMFGADEVAALRELCGEDTLHFELVRELLSIERRHRTMARRPNIFHELERALRKGFYENEEDAVTRARSRTAPSTEKPGEAGEAEFAR
ncbi:DNA phosphorothioation system sulfurtransferase DndC [Azospirillum sp. sgz302134]